VSVSAGTYEESVGVDVEGLTLEAAAGASQKITISQDSTSTLEVTANDVTVDGVDISGNVTGGTPTTAVEGDGTTLTNLAVTHNGDADDNVGQAVRVAASDVTIDNIKTDTTGANNTAVSVITDTRGGTKVSLSHVEIVDSEFTINENTTGVLVGLARDSNAEFIGDNPVTIENNEFIATSTDRSNVTYVVDVDYISGQATPGDVLDLDTVLDNNFFAPDTAVFDDLSIIADAEFELQS